MFVDISVHRDMLDRALLFPAGHVGQCVNRAEGGGEGEQAACRLCHDHPPASHLEMMAATNLLCTFIYCVVHHGDKDLTSLESVVPWFLASLPLNIPPS